MGWVVIDCELLIRGYGILRIEWYREGLLCCFIEKVDVCTSDGGKGTKDSNDVYE